MNHPARISRRGFLRAGIATGLAASALAREPAAGSESSAKPSSAKPRWKICCYTRPWDQHDWRVALDQIAEAGFRYAGLMTTKSKSRLVISTATDPEEALKIGEEARKRGLRIPSVYAGSIPVQAPKEKRIQAMRRLIDCCAAARAESLLMGGVGQREHYDPYYEAIEECAGYAAEKKVGITIKPHGGLNATGPQCRRVIEGVGHENFRLWYDPGNIFYYSDGKLDPVEDAATVDGLVVGMCVKDYLHPKNVMVTPGDGKVDFPAVLARLRQGGFREGALVIETLSRGDLAHLLREAKRAREFVEALVKA